VKIITSRQNPVVRSFRELATNPDPTGARVLLDGVHLVREGTTSAKIEIAVVASSRLAGQTEEADLAHDLDRLGVEIVSASDSTFAAISPVQTPSGIAAIARHRPSTASGICSSNECFILAACDIQDPGNVGSLIRASEAGGVTGMLVCGASANPFSWKALRGSMGSALRLPIAARLSAEEALGCMTLYGIRTVATVAHGGRSPDSVDWRGRIGLFLGGEGAGLDERIVAGCDERVTIPMARPVESLNVAVAGAILIYEARRARG
jgi:TrmH family RNA methyltransferase